MFASVTITHGGFVVVVDHPNTILIFTQANEEEEQAKGLIQTGKTVFDDEVKCIHASPRSRTVAVALTRELRVFQITDDCRLHLLFRSPLLCSPSSCHMHHDNTHWSVACGAAFGVEMITFDNTTAVVSKSVIEALPAADSNISCLCLSHDGDIISMSGLNGLMSVYRISSKNYIYSCIVSISDLVTSMAFSHDDAILAASTWKGSVHLFTLDQKTSRMMPARTLPSPNIIESNTICMTPYPQLAWLSAHNLFIAVSSLDNTHSTLSVHNLDVNTLRSAPYDHSIKGVAALSQSSAVIVSRSTVDIINM